MNWLLNFIASKSYFPKVHTAEGEQRKVAILRIFIGIIILVRFTEISYSLNLYYDSGEYKWASVYLITLVICFTIGLFTPVTTILLLCSLHWFDTLAGTYNLGTVILIFTLLILLLINQGYYYSLDSLLFKGDGILSKLLIKVYKLIGYPSKEDITKVYIFGFILYAVISFGALLFHVSDEYWLEGLTIKSLLTSSYLSKHYQFFRWLESSSPVLFGVFSITAGIIQSIFQFLMIPLIFFKVGKRFVVIWGLSFALVSLFFINLSYLPHIELLFWLLIFFPVRSLSKKYSTIRIGEYRKAFLNKFYSIYGLILILFILLWFPILGNWIRASRVFKDSRISTFPKHFKTGVEKVGLQIPDVFNKVDLSMGNNWMLLYRMGNYQKWELVPITNLDGSRINYNGFDILNFTNHNTDFLYFGSTLRYRRHFLQATDITLFHEDKDQYGRKNIEQKIRYDFKYNRFKDPKLYKVEVFSSKSSQASLFESNSERHIPALIYTKLWMYDGKKLSEGEIQY